MTTPSITHDRVELKYKLSPAHASEFGRNVGAHMAEHRFEGNGANRLPRARHYVTTVYFDTPSLDLYRAVRERDDHLKVRAREYYDVHPELLELATSQADIVRYRPVLWLELKGKLSGRTYKRRVGIPKQDVAAFFERGEVSAAMREIQREQRGAAGDDVIAELLELRARYAESLRPSCIANYRRIAFQNAEGSLRITLDQRLACFAPPSDLLDHTRPLLRDQLGQARYEEPAIVLEVKVSEAVPAWLEALLGVTRAERTVYSKFVTATEAVCGASEAIAPRSSTRG